MTDRDEVERRKARMELDRALNTPTLSLREIRQLKERLAEVERERDEWASMVGQIVACLPLKDIVPASTTMGDLIAVLKEIIRERDDLRHDLARLKKSETQAINDLEKARARVAAVAEEAWKPIVQHSDRARKRMVQYQDQGGVDGAHVWSSIVSHLDIESDRIRALARPEETDALAERERIAFNSGWNRAMKSLRTLEELSEESPRQHGGAKP